MFCNNCGKEISDNQKFCDGCGMQLNVGTSKKIVTVGAATGEFIADWIFMSIIIGLFTSGIESAISETFGGSVVATIIVSLIMSTLLMMLMCVCTTKLTFGKKIIKHEELNNFIKNICIFWIVLTILGTTFSSLTLLPVISEINECTEETLSMSQWSNYLAINKIMTEANVSFVEARDMLVKQTALSAFGVIGVKLLLNLVIIIVLIVPFEKKLMKSKMEAIN